MTTLRIRLKPYLDDLRSRTRTNRDVAAELKVNEQSLSRVLKAIPSFIKDPPPDRKATTALNRARIEHRTELAKNTNLSLEQAAKAACVSVRTMYRYRQKARK